MTLEILKHFLLWCTIINYAILLLWFGMSTFARHFICRLHSRWFKLSAEQFSALHYGGISIYKILVLLFNLVPLIALHIMT